MARVYTHFSVKDYFLILLIIILSTSFAIFFQLNQIISGDQMQMLEKGYMGAITGNYLPYGNAASTVGNVPGSLSSYIVGYPLSLFMHPLSPVAVLILLRVLSIIIFVNAVSKIFLPRTTVIATLLYALSPWFLYDELLYNPSYLALGAAIFLNMLVRLRVRGHKVSYATAFLSSLMLSLSAGFCLQLHFSWPVLVAICGILYLRRDITISFVGIFVGLALVAATLIPYINEFMVNEAIRENSSQDAKDRYFGYGLLHVYPVLKALVYWFRFGSLLITKKALVPDVAADAPLYLEILRYIYLGITQIIGAVTLIIAVYANYKVISSSPYAQNDGMRFVRSLTIASMLALMLAGAISTITFSYWHLIIIFSFALLPVLVLIERSHRIRTAHILYLALIMLVMNFISAFNSDKFNINASYTDQVNYLCLEKYDVAQCGLTKIEAQSLESRRLDTIFFGNMLSSMSSSDHADVSIDKGYENKNVAVSEDKSSDNNDSSSDDSKKSKEQSQSGEIKVEPAGSLIQNDSLMETVQPVIEVDRSSDKEGTIVLGNG